MAEELRRFLSALRGGGWRGLVLAFGEPRGVYSLLAEALAGERGLLVYWPGRGVDAARVLLRGFSLVYAGHLHERLGEEHRVVIVDAFEGLQANTLAASAEMVVGGGVLIVAGEGWRSLSAPGSTGAFSEWMRRRILAARNVLVLEDGVVVHRRGPERGPSRWLPGASGTGLPSWLEALLCCPEQGEVARKAEALVRRYEAGVLLVTGDRGRGKSASVGLALAYLIARRLVGDVAVTGPSLHSTQSLFQWLARGLRAARVRFRAWGPGRLYEGVKGAWFRVRYLDPSRAEPAPLTVIEEAAAVGPARVRRIAGRSRNVIAVTTIHGYEGSGRYWLRVLTRQLPPVEIVELRVPVRYAPGDPLEELLYDALMLRPVDPEELPICRHALNS